MNKTLSEMGQSNSYERIKEPDARQQNSSSSGIQNPMFSGAQSNSWKGDTSNSNNNSWSNNSSEKDRLIDKKNRK